MGILAKYITSFLFVTVAGFRTRFLLQLPLLAHGQQEMISSREKKRIKETKKKGVTCDFLGDSLAGDRETYKAD